MTLRRIGYWGGFGITSLPDAAALAGEQWDEVEKEEVEDFLSRGFVSRAFLGKARCRICQIEVGNLELTDGVYSWPEGLKHYVGEHSVRLPRPVIDHILATAQRLMEEPVDDQWWADATGVEPSSNMDR